MAKAMPSLAPVMTLAKFYARKRVIEAAKAAGIRYRELSAAEITRRACDYLDGPHGPELLAKATATLAEWAERDRIRRERRRQLRRSYITSGAPLRGR